MKRDASQPVTYDITKGTPTVAVGWYGRVKGKDGKTKDKWFESPEQSALMVFEQTFVTGTKFYKNRDKAKPLYGLDYGGMIYAVKEFGIGEPLFSLAAEDQVQENFKKMLVGDLGTTSGHAWLVGDVRYGIWCEQNKTRIPDYLVDQSSFLGDSETGTLVPVSSPLPKSTSLRDIDGRGASRKQTANKNGHDPEYESLTRADCDWLMVPANEETLKRRLKALLEKEPDPKPKDGSPPRPAGEITIPGGGSCKVRKIEVLYWRVFSANGGYNTAHAMEFDGSHPTAKSRYKQAPFKRDNAESAKRFPARGITRPWVEDPKRPVAVGRLYGPAIDTSRK